MFKLLENFLEKLMFASRWIMAPFYFGLIISLFLLLLVFLNEIFHFIIDFQADETELILFILTLIDLSFAGNLLIIVIFSGYENFVSKINVDNHEDKPEWMGTVDFGGLKLKLISCKQLLFKIIITLFKNISTILTKLNYFLLTLHLKKFIFQ